MILRMWQPIFKFSRVYFLLAIMLFLTEVFIAICLHDAVIRPYGGDFLVVILIYCFVKSFLNTPVKATALAVLLFSYLIETLQYFHLVNLLGLEKSNLAHVVIGTSFAWADLLAYTLGILLIMLVEAIYQRKFFFNLVVIKLITTLPGNSTSW